MNRVQTKLLAMALALLSSTSEASTSSLNSPNVSANALFLYRNSNFAREENSVIRNGVDLREAELAFYADVDPYSRLFLTLSLHPEYNLSAGGNGVDQEWKFEPEEAYADSNHIPYTTLKIGKFKAAFGKHNQLHSHAFPFIDAPIANTNLLGDEGLNDVGVSAAFIIPTPWFSELVAQYLRGEGENTPFQSPGPNDGVGVVHLKNLWDLTDSLTLELGASGAKGNNSLRANTTLWGSDLTFKWRPLEGGKYTSWVFAGEFMKRNLQQSSDRVPDEIGKGWNAWARYQFSQRWSASLRYDQLEVSGSDNTLNPNVLPNIITKKYSGGIEFNATEFSSFRAEYNQAKGPTSANGADTEKKFYLQANFTIGAHPSHGY